MSLASFLLKGKFAILNNREKLDYAKHISPYLLDPSLKLDKGQQSLIIKEAFVAREGIEPVVDMLNSGFDQDVLNEAMPTMTQRMKDLSPVEVSGFLHSVPHIFTDYPRREISREAMSLLKGSLDIMGVVDAFYAIDGFLKVYKASNVELLTKLTSLHKDAIKRLAEDKPEVYMKRILSVFDTHYNAISSISSYDSKTYLTDLAQNIVFPLIKDDKPAAIFFQMFLEDKQIVLPESRRSFGEEALKLRHAWEVSAKDAKQNVECLEHELALAKEKLEAKRFPLTISGIKGNFLSAVDASDKRSLPEKQAAAALRFSCTEYSHGLKA